MADLAQLQLWLTEAQTAYHSAMAGGQIVSVTDQNGERIEYSRTNTNSLLKYIAYLQSQINLILGVAVTGGPLRPFF